MLNNFYYKYKMRFALLSLENMFSKKVKNITFTILQNSIQTFTFTFIKSLKFIVNFTQIKNIIK